MIGPFVATNAQTSKLQITATGAHSTFEHGLSQPAQFLQAIGITPEEVQRALEPRAHISVVGASFTRNLQLTAFTSTQNTQTKSSIQVEGAGAARILELVAFTEIPNQLPKSSIDVAGASFVRVIKLIAPASP
jgi:hypothetical protein